jgi:hypothetical protein
MTNRMLLAIALGAVMALMGSLYFALGAKIIATAKPPPSKVVKQPDNSCFDCKWPVKEVNRVDPNPSTVPYVADPPPAPRVSKGTGSTTAPAPLPATSLPAITSTTTSTVESTVTKTRTNDPTGIDPGSSQLGTTTRTTHRTRSTVMGTQHSSIVEGSPQSPIASRTTTVVVPVQPDS